jgi:long-chain fatty acid transport protein
LLISFSFAGGFELYEFGAASSALAGATVARAWDASTVFYNPAGIAFLEGSNFYGGVTLITAKNKFVGASPLFDETIHESEDAIHTPIGIYYTHQFDNGIAAGIGVTNPFGLGLGWDKNEFPGRGIAFNTDLKSFYVSPVLAGKITDEFSVSAGLDLVLGMVTLERSVYMMDSETSPGTEVAHTEITGTSDLAIGYTLSMQFRTEDVGFGLLYRAGVSNKLEEGDAKFTFLDSPIRGFAENILMDQNVSAGIEFPGFISIGAYYKLLDNMGIEFDYMWTNWEVFEKIEFKFDDPNLDATVNEDYENSSTFRVGVHYDINEELQVRAGYIWDETPQPVHSVSPMLPDNDRNDYSIGLGYKMDNMQFDVGYMLVDFGTRSTLEDGVGQNEYGFNGEYSSMAHLFFLGYGISF